MLLGSFDIYFTVKDNIAYAVEHGTQDTGDTYCCTICITKSSDAFDILNQIGNGLKRYGKHHAALVSQRLEIPQSVLRRWILKQVDDIKKESEQNIQYFRSVWYFTETQKG